VKKTNGKEEKIKIDENISEKVLFSMEKMAEVIKDSVSRIREEKIQEKVKAMIEMIFSVYGTDYRIFTTGEGRSKLAGEAFAMRLMHLGFSAYILGEPTTPGIRQDDIVIAISGSGTTETVKKSCEIAIEERIGAKLIVITSKKRSILARMADIVIDLPGRQGIISDKDYLERTLRGDFPRLPMKTVFETNAGIFCDSVISELMALTKTTEEKMESQHATDRKRT